MTQLPPNRFGRTAMNRSKVQFRPPSGPKLVVVAIIMVALGLAGYLTIHFSFAEVTTTPEATDQLIVKYKVGANRQALHNRFSKTKGVETLDNQPLRMKVVKVPRSQRDKAKQDLVTDPDVQYVEGNPVRKALATTPNDPYYSLQWSWPKTGIDTVWDKTTGSSNITIAVIDSGVNSQHTEFSGKLLPGYDFVNNDSDPTDDYGHGTAVAMIAAGNTNNNFGMAGTCWTCKILPIKALDNTGHGTAAGVIQGIQYAADHGARIINISIGDVTFSQAEQDAVNYAISKGVLIVAAAGNESLPAPVYPAAYPGVIAVAGTDKDNKMYTLSNYGDQIKIAAPGSDVLIPYFTDTVHDDITQFGYASGTSYASPLIAGLSALLLAAFPTATNAQITNALLTTTDPCCDGKIAGGVVNATKAYANLLTLFPPADTTKPTINLTTPAANTTVSGAVQITADATDNVAVTRVQFQVTGGATGTDTAAPYSSSWDTTKVANGNYTITATAYDAAGNSAIASITVTVDNVVTPPPNQSPDIDSNGIIDIYDLSKMLTKLNTSDSRTDLDHSGKVDLVDLSILLAKWHQAP